MTQKKTQRANRIQRPLRALKECSRFVPYKNKRKSEQRAVLTKMLRNQIFPSRHFPGQLKDCPNLLFTWKLTDSYSLEMTHFRFRAGNIAFLSGPLFPLKLPTGYSLELTKQWMISRDLLGHLSCFHGATSTLVP